ncbi:MAG TPA: Gfo/Idh/MocA family oxidoreductase [Thermomicrobiales bacterium]|nr:Gfo/Idh/MocA family oxidoreductase [Thermomicrobiales bacterium]
MSKSLGIGIAGAGFIGKVQANALREIDGAEVVAIADPREDAGQALATATGARWYPSYTEMLEHPELDVVVLTTPSGLHAEQAVLAAQAGKHIITEKPMSTTPHGIQLMTEAAERANVELAVIFQNRFSRDVIKVKRGIEAGMLGRPVMGSAAVHWHRTAEYYEANDGWRGTWTLDGGGALMNQSVHTIDLLQWLMGGVSAVSANAATLIHEIETEDTATASVVFRSGALGTIAGTTSASTDAPVRVEIVGTGGRAMLERGVLVAWEGDSPLTDDILLPFDHDYIQGWEPGEPFGAAHKRQLAVILDALRSGDTPPVPPREARKAVDIVLAVYESAQTGKHVAID